MDPFPPPSQTAVQHQTSEQQETEQGKYLLQQDKSQTRPSACPTARWRRQTTWMNSSIMCAIPQRTCILYQVSSATLSSASPSSSMQTTLRSLTRTKQTSTMPKKHQSSSLVAQSPKDGDASKRTYGKSPSSKMSRTTTLTQSSVIDSRRNFFLTGHRPVTQSTMCTS